MYMCVCVHGPSGSTSRKAKSRGEIPAQRVESPTTIPQQENPTKAQQQITKVTLGSCTRYALLGLPAGLHCQAMKGVIDVGSRTDLPASRARWHVTAGAHPVNSCHATIPKHSGSYNIRVPTSLHHMFILNRSCQATIPMPRHIPRGAPPLPPHGDGTPGLLTRM